jgi:hypothetical protein
MTRRVTPGEPALINAAEFNRWQHAADLADATLGGGVGLVELGPYVPRAHEPRADVILAKNDAGTEAPRFAGVHVLAPVVASDNALGVWTDADAWTFDVPDDTVAPALFGVCLEAIPAGKIGAVAVGGRFPIKLDISANDERYAHVKDTAYDVCASDIAGPLRILSRAGTGSDVWAVVEMSLAHMRVWTRAQITGASGGGSNQWTYTGTELPIGYGVRSAGAQAFTNLANVLELGNDGSGVEYNQVDLTNDAPDGGSLALRAIETGTRVAVEVIAGTVHGEAETVFSVPNGVTVTCPS